MTRKQAEAELKKTFGIDHFYDEQWTAIDRIMKGQRVLLIEKTGFGKSLCYQFPATQFSGLTIVFSPLLALMRDQLKAMQKRGIACRCINSEETPAHNSETLKLAVAGKLKILYIAPERQEDMWWMDSIKKLKLSMVVIDEAHCVSTWGHDFRPTYKRIIQLINLMDKKMPVLATTATATKRVEADIQQQMGGDSTIIRGNLMRENLRLFVVKVQNDDEKMMWLGKNINELEGNGIIYTGTRTNTEVYARWMQFLGVSSIAYNAGLDRAARILVENSLMSNDYKCIVSTNALGMGIDKPDIRFIIHTQMPVSPIHYYQEIGRAGRDGKPTNIILLHGPKDRRLPEIFINGHKPSTDKYEILLNILRKKKMSERELMKESEMNYFAVKVIVGDLINQRIVREIKLGMKRVLEYMPGAKPINTEKFAEYRKAQMDDLDMMENYVNTTESRMKFLCDYLGDEANNVYTNCDNTSAMKYEFAPSKEWEDKVVEFRESFFPDLKIKTLGLTMVNGIAASYYNVATISQAIQNAKANPPVPYPLFLQKLVLKAFKKRLGKEHFDYIMFVPSERTGKLMQSFAEKLSKDLDIPVSYELIKTRETKEHGTMGNMVMRMDNVKDAFKIEDNTEIKGKSILLIDDVYDSGTTMQEIGRLLTLQGAAKTTPLVMAMTAIGDELQNLD
ncbi:MAG: RecQ family ATP-dependent DNA helicase [Bacteroidota bacterium]